MVIPSTLDLSAVWKGDVSCPWKKFNMQKGKLPSTCRLSFPDVIKAMQRSSSSKPPCQVASELKNLKITAYMRKLHPFLDNVRILRVGGQLENALINYEAKHPIVLPYHHHAIDLIISQHLQKTGHLGKSMYCQVYISSIG